MSDVPTQNVLSENLVDWLMGSCFQFHCFIQLQIQHSDTPIL